MANLSAISFLLVYAIFGCSFLSGGYARCNDAARVACGRSIQLSGDQPLFIPIGYHTKHTHKTSSPPSTTRNQFPRKHVPFKHPAVAAAASSLEELRLTLDWLEYLIAKIAPSPLVAPLFPSHSIISKDNKGENKVGVALEEDKIAFKPCS